MRTVHRQFASCRAQGKSRARQGGICAQHIDGFPAAARREKDEEKHNAAIKRSFEIDQPEGLQLLQWMGSSASSVVEALSP